MSFISDSQVFLLCSTQQLLCLSFDYHLNLRIHPLEAVDAVRFVVLCDDKVSLLQDFRTEGTVEVPAVILSIISVDTSSFSDWFVT